ncbi:aspartic peptidase domain-containing protein [Flagelloscypha sp. PMI_526]|nr:aspartic peptidase domain-containing protein [Flagelloscypha sp. PMI_526]
MLAFVSLALLAPFATALHLPVRTTRQLRSFVPRGSGALENQNDLKYWTNITLGGRNFEALIDTGSSDLWVATSTPLSGSIDTGKSATIQYAIGSATGPIKTNELKDFLGFSVPEQAYLEVTPVSSNPLTIEGTGLIGLGPRFGSNIYITLDASTASVPVIDSIFLQNTSTPNFVSYLLGRENDPTNALDGNITVSTVLPGYEKILDQTKVPAVNTINQGGFSHWALLVDAIKAPNGKNIDLKSTIKSNFTDKFAVNPNGKLVAMMDTGFTFSQVPSYITDAFYKDINGAKQINIGGVQAWVFPCTTELNITVTIGGTEYPIHSLDASDLVTDSFDPKDKDAVLDALKSEVSFKGDACQGTFQEISPTLNSLPLDLILGMNFLRNVYELINHGDFVADNNTARGDPYFQFLSTTNDTALTHQEFVKVRGEGKTSFKSKGPLGLSWGVIGGLIAGIILIILSLVICFCWKRKKSHRSIAPRLPVNMPFVGGSRGQYAQVGKDEDDEHLMRTQSHLAPPGAGGGHAAEYYDAFDSRQSMERVSYDMGSSGHGYSGQTGK